MKVYVVMGSTGEYSDHNEWVVGAFLSEGKAKERVELASTRARELTLPDYPYMKEGEKNEYDPEFRADYTGTNYFYYTVSVLDAP